MSRRIFSIRDIDWITVSLYLGLAVIGWVMIHAAGFDPGESQSMFSFSNRAGKQFYFLLFSVFVGGAVLFIDPRFFKTISPFLYWFFIAALIFVYIVGTATNGATSWINLAGGVKFQPSEPAKFATCLALASFMSGARFNIKEIPMALAAIGVFLLPSALVVLQGDAGSAIVFFSLMIALFREGMHPAIYIIALLFILLFVFALVFNPLTVVLLMVIVAIFISAWHNKPRPAWMMAASVLSIGLIFFSEYFTYCIIAAGAFLLASLGMNIFKKDKSALGIFLGISVVLYSLFTLGVDYAFNNILEPHQQDRIKVWLMPSEADPRGSYYNLRQSKLAIGSGGMWGKGFTEGELTQGNYVPEQDTDFIFTVIGEEQGFVGTFGVILLYAALLFRITQIAERQRSKFTRIYAYGVSGIIGIHLLINIGMTMGLMPVIGIPLPLLSYGGSSLLSFTIMIAILVKFDSQRLLVFR